MTLFSYEIFDAVARQGSFNKAAQQLHLTPSAISHAIAVMEAELGFTLFNRGKNGVTMTSYGASLYPSIRAVLNICYWECFVTVKGKLSRYCPNSKQI